MAVKDLRLERKRRRWEANKLFILKAAENIFAQKGYSLTTMDDIAAEAQFSKATIYRYFQSKNELFFEIILNSFDEVAQKLRKIKQKEESSVQKVKDIINFTLGFYHQKKNIPRIFLMEKSLMFKIHHLLPESDGSLGEAEVKMLDNLKNKTDRIYRIMSEIFQEGIKNGEFRPMNVMDACYILDALLHGFYFKRFWLDKKYSYTKSAELIQSFFLLGIIKEEKKG